MKVIRPKAPFDLLLAREAYGYLRDASHRWLGDLYCTTVLVDGEPTVLGIRETGTVDDPSLAVVSSDGRFPPVAELRRILSADEDLGPFYAMAQGDPAMGPLVAKYRGARPVRPQTLFEIAVIAVVEQQISLTAAASIRERFVKSLGAGPIVFQGEEFWAHPAPARVAACSAGDLRSLGMSFRKAETLLDLSRRLESGEFSLEAVREMPEEKAVAHIMSLKGFGPWSARYILVRGAGFADSMPYDDLAVRKQVGRLYGDGGIASTELSKRALLRWRPYRRLAGYYLLLDSIWPREGG